MTGCKARPTWTIKPHIICLDYDKGHQQLVTGIPNILPLSWSKLDGWTKVYDQLLVFTAGGCLSHDEWWASQGMVANLAGSFLDIDVQSHHNGFRGRWMNNDE